MARRAHAYPQVAPTAGDLIDGGIVVAPPALSATDATRLARRRGADVLAAGAGGWVLREDAARADALGIGRLPIRRLARPLARVTPREPEIGVRRRLAAGAPAVVVTRGRTPLGVIRRAPPPAVLSMQPRFERVLDAGTRALLATAGRLAAAHGARAFIVGGLVRDVWLGSAPARRDLDVVVEGDGPVVARALAAELGGTLVEHERFLTASVTLADGGRIDVVTARSERYEAPGALPRVLPAAIAHDLRRRDFSVNAMAVELGSGTFGLLDPLGGVADVERRRVRVLHPLSFVEDPTRLFRAARYAARLGFALDAWTVRCRALALELVPYAALSPARMATELDRILADDAPGTALAALARAGVFRLLTPRFRASSSMALRLAELPHTLDWARAHAVTAPGLEVLAAALAAGQPDDVAAATLRGLGLTGAPLERVREAIGSAAALTARLIAAQRPSESARALRGSSPTALAWLHVTSDAAGRQRLERVIGADREARPHIGGDEVVALGVTRGPEVAAALAALRDARLDGEIRDRQGEIDYVRARLGTWKKEG